MSLGNGCYWKSTCKYYANQADSFHKKTYCNDDHGCDKCSHRPMNIANEKVRQDEAYRRSEHSTVKIGQIAIIIFIILAIVGMFLK